MNCSICHYWNPRLGCNHKEPDNPYKELVPAIVALAHNGNKEIIETHDFREGVGYAVKFFKDNINNANLIAFLRGETETLEL